MVSTTGGVSILFAIYSKLRPEAKSGRRDARNWWPYDFRATLVWRQSERKLLNSRS